jgi:integrase
MLYQNFETCRPTYFLFLGMFRRHLFTVRNIHLHADLISTLTRIYKTLDVTEGVYLLRSREGSVYSLQYINRKLKKLDVKYGLGISFSTHSFRKTFGRRIWDKNDNSEKSLILLGQIFNHSSVAITKRYLGIREQEIKNVYLSL